MEKNKEVKLLRLRTSATKKTVLICYEDELNYSKLLLLTWIGFFVTLDWNKEDKATYLL
jgi:hypothetical protein